VPVIGPILAAGPIAAALTGAGIGAAAGGLIGALTESGIPENEAKYYAEGVRRGDVLVTVKTDEARADRVCDVLDRHDAVDVDDRVQNWKTRGWSGWDSSAEPYTSEDLQKERSYYRSGKDPAVSGQVGGIGTEGLPTPYDERTDRSTIGTTGMSGAGLTGGTGSGYAGQPSGHVSGRDLSDPRDRDKDGWVADDKMRDAGRSAKRGAREMKEDAKDMFRDREHDRPLGTTASDTVTDPRDKDRDGWVADDKMREWGRDIKDAVSGTGNKLKQQGRELREEARDTEQSMEAERRRRARVYDRTLL
jgi:Sec-independent protein translocase protein TatA